MVFACKLVAGPAVAQHDPVHQTLVFEAIDGPENRRGVSLEALAGQCGLEIFDGPAVLISFIHKIREPVRDHRPSTHARNVTAFC